MNTEFSVAAPGERGAALSGSRSSLLTPDDILLFPLDDHGAVQSQPQEFHFYGEDL